MPTVEEALAKAEQAYKKLKNKCSSQIMNYLAHIYLSGSSPQIRVGGFIADAVKGGIPEHYPYKLRSEFVCIV